MSLQSHSNEIGKKSTNKCREKQVSTMSPNLPTNTMIHMQNDYFPNVRQNTAMTQMASLQWAGETITHH